MEMGAQWTKILLLGPTYLIAFIETFMVVVFDFSKGG